MSRRVVPAALACALAGLATGSVIVALGAYYVAYLVLKVVTS